jgi:hypothetical protein
MNSSTQPWIGLPIANCRLPIAGASSAIRFALLLAMAWLVGGCASPSGDAAAPKPGRGIAEYRDVARDARGAVAATVTALDALAHPPARTSVRHPALPRFDRAFHELELTSVKARARAEAIIARGQSYFDEWKEHLAGVTNQAAARVETANYERLHRHFERVRQLSGAVREEFRPFMGKLREFRARLDQPPGPTAAVPAGNEPATLAGNGRRVLQALDSVSTALDDAETELRATMKEAKP